MLLLDSQVAVWILDNSPRLGPQARAAIAAASSVHVSAASVWELTIKAMLGKLTIPAKLADHLTDEGLELLSVSAEHAEAIREFPELARHDPFDRLIVAQASKLGLQLITADDILLDLDRKFIVDARV